MSEWFFFLGARASIFEGAARILDFGDTLTEFNQSVSPEQADATAMRADWETVGADLRDATSQYETGRRQLDRAEAAQAEACRPPR